MIVFVLRRAVADSAADQALVDLLRRDAVVYGRFSAGPCLLSPDLSELRHVDDPPSATQPIPTCLGMLDRLFVPHVNSPRTPETGACSEISDYDHERG